MLRFASPHVTCTKVLDKVNTIVALVHHSQAALDKLCEAQKSSGLNEATLPESCPARWWSTIATVQAFFKNRAAVKLLCVWARDSEKDKLPTLTGYEWMVSMFSGVFGWFGFV